MNVVMISKSTCALTDNSDGELREVPDCGFS